MREGLRKRRGGGGEEGGAAADPPTRGGGGAAVVQETSRELQLRNHIVVIPTQTMVRKKHFFRKVFIAMHLAPIL